MKIPYNFDRLYAPAPTLEELIDYVVKKSSADFLQQSLYEAATSGNMVQFLAELIADQEK